MKFVHAISLLSVTALLSVGGDAHAVQTPAAFARRPAVEVAHGAPVRVAGELDWHRVPAQHRRAWQGVLAAMGPRTWAVWDHDTGVVRRIWGAGVAAPGSLGSAAAAERVARGFLEQHIRLLAPGAAASDFVLVANQVDAGMRTLGFVQRVGGVPVDGGQVSFRFKNDRLFMIGSEALPHVPAPAAVAVRDADAAAAALAWVRRDTTKSARVTTTGGVRVLPLIRAGRVDYATVIPVVVESSAPRGRWTVYVDAARGTPVARVQTLRFAQGTVKYNAPTRGPSGMRKDYPAYKAQLLVNNVATTSSATGVVNWNGNNAATVAARPLGDQINVDNDSGQDASQNLNLASGGTAVWNAAASEQVDAQVATFVHTNEVMNYARVLEPANNFYAQQFKANVNIDDSCNAYYDGEAINFFRQSGDCNNTGRISDIVYHEFGHAVHDHAVIQGVGQFEGALSEGVSDYLCTTINDDPAMAVEFFLGDPNPLRHLDPPGDEATWPEDIDGNDPHITGLIIGGALWDLRKALIAEQGPGAVAVADRLYYEAIRRAVDIPTMYFEAVAADDDDGDLDNGTPNICLINEAFAAHGLYNLGIDVSAPGVAVPQLDGYDVSAKLSGGGGDCAGSAVESADLVWRLREDPNVGGTVPMNIGPDAITGTIPKQLAGTVVQYQIRIGLTGSDLQYPDNRADTWYEMFVGAVEDIYCTDFETDPAADGWTHGLSQGQQMEGADDWKWGVPLAPTASGDPAAAFDGTQVFGNDLGGGEYNGTYQPDKTNFAKSQAIDTTGYSQVRLQYRRWLTVEDGFFDRASIYANDEVVWQNLQTPDEQAASVHHIDREWRFHDVDLTDQVIDDSVTLKYEIKSDGGLEMGGWTIDALCVVGVVAAEGAICGDGIVTAPEQCDDGADNSDSAADACRTDCTSATCGDGVVDGGEVCDDGNTVDDDGCPADCSDGGATSDDTTPATSTSAGPDSDGDTGGVPTGSDGDGGDSNPSTPTSGPDGSEADASGDSSGSGSAGAGVDDEGCGCREDAAPTPTLALFGLAALGLRRRRR